jgi:hypothetical protein
MFYAIYLYVGLIVGLVFAIGFLSVHRPRYFYRLTEVNASYWVIVIALLYIRSLVLLFLRGVRPPEAWVDVVISLGLLTAIDALLVIRFFSYLSYLKKTPKGPRGVS